MALAEAVVAACEQPSDFQFLYPLDITIKEKIEIIARKVYGADGVDTPEAEAQIAAYEKAGYGGLPICMAKTHLSISHDPTLKGVPTGFTLPVRGACAPVWAPASSTRCAARCAPCPACRASRCSSTWTWTRTARWLGCSKPIFGGFRIAAQNRGVGILRCRI